ncbi:hypothetical protein CR513_10062, partial [Mucuna pruriens]
MKQLTKIPTKHELQQHAILAKYERHHPRPQDADKTTRNISAGCRNLPSQKILNSRGNASVQRPRPIDVDSKSDADSHIPQQDKSVLLSFPTRTLSIRKLESDEELLKMFWKVEINIPLLEAIKQIPKYVKFLKELCVHKRKKMKGGVELGGIVLTLTINDDIIAESQQPCQRSVKTSKFSLSHAPLVIVPLLMPCWT